MQLRKPTTIERATCTGVARIILKPETDAPKNAVRKVTVLVPNEDTVSIAVDQTPQAIGGMRAYKVPEFPSGMRIPFHLLAEQSLLGLCSSGTSEVTLIVEYV